MSKFNEKKPTSKTENLAGGVAYKHSPEMELITAVLTTFLENKYYESGDDRINRIKDLVQKCDDEFVGKLAVVARTEFNLRSVSHLLVAELSRKHRGDNLVSKVLERIAVRPDDLTEVVAYLKEKFPKQIKKGIRHALYKFSPYQLAKYKMENKEVKLVDLFNIAHPNPKHYSEPAAFASLLNGTLKNTETWEARLSSGEDKKIVWGDLIMRGKLGYMALLRNLRNISTQANEITQQEACKIISDPEQVRKSRQLPFRFFNAYEQVDDRKMLNAIAEALNHSVSNVPKLEGKILVAVDGSGSMTGDPIKKASILAAALIKQNDADLIIYDERLQNFKYLNSEPVLTLSKRIRERAEGGGTNTSLVFDYADGKKYDRIIILSDNESWQDSYWGRGTQSAYEQYKKTNGNPFIYAVDIQGYGTKDVKGERVYHLCGFSEKIFEFMKWIEKENQLVDYIKSIKI